MDNKINNIGHPETATKKRLLFVITQSEWGGAQRFLHGLISNLDPSKYEIMVATAGSKNLPEALEKIGIAVKNLKFLKRKISPYYDFRVIFELRKLIEEFKPDSLFLNSSKVGVVGSIAAKNYPVKVIYRIGGWSFNDPLPLVVRWFYILAEKYTAKLKDYIIVNNLHDFEQAKKLKIRPRQKLELIYNGIDPYKLEFLEKDEARLKLAAAFKQKTFHQAKLIVGTIANFYKTKGLIYLIKAARMFFSEGGKAETVFVIIGDGPERQNLETEIKNAGLENRFLLAGTIPDAYKYLTAFDIFILPSVKEGFPWALLEAMSAKLPVIATSVGAVPEIIENQKNGFMVGPGKPEEIVRTLKLLVTDENVRREFGIQAHQTVILNFDQNKMLEKIKSLL